MHDFGHLGGYHKHSVRLFLYLDRGPSLLNEACQLRLSSDAGNSNSWVKPREAQLSHSIYHNLSGNNLILQIPGFKFTPQSRDFDHRLLQYHSAKQRFRSSASTISMASDVPPRVVLSVMCARTSNQDQSIIYLSQFEGSSPALFVRTGTTAKATNATNEAQVAITTCDQ